MKKLTVALLASLYLILTAGCGQSGPLYVPGNPTRISVPPPAAEPVEESAKDEEDSGSERE